MASVTAACALQEAARRGQKVSQGLRGGAQGALVHRLPLEESLPALHRLKRRLSHANPEPSALCSLPRVLQI